MDFDELCVGKKDEQAGGEGEWKGDDRFEDQVSMICEEWKDGGEKVRRRRRRLSSVERKEQAEVRKMNGEGKGNGEAEEDEQRGGRCGH